jgi:hypothetical protein
MKLGDHIKYYCDYRQLHLEGVVIECDHVDVVTVRLNNGFRDYISKSQVTYTIINQKCSCGANYTSNKAFHYKWCNS